MKNVTFRQLRIFEAVARHLSYSRAAAELHLTQPAVSMQIRSLEEAAALPLFEQLGKKVYLTEAGRELVRHARAIAAELNDAEQTLASLRGVSTGMLNIGVVSTAKYFAPHLLARFAAENPGVRLRLSVQNRERVIRQLDENEIDVAIMGRTPEGSDIVAQVFAAHPMAIIAAPGHPLVGRRQILPADLVAEPFVVREPGSGTRATMERFFADCNVNLDVMLEMASNETIKQAVMAGMGLAFLSLHTVGLELSVGRLAVLDVQGLPIMRQWHVAARREKRLSPAAEAFRAFLLDRGAALIEVALSGEWE